MNQEIQMKPFGLEHSNLLLSWRNLPSVRKYSRNTEPISVETHKLWIKNYFGLTNKKFIFIFFIDNEPIGMTRLDKLENAQYEISIIIAPKYQNKGYSKKLVRETLQHADSILGCREVIAAVHNQNFVSCHLFESLGFWIFEDSDTFIKYILKI